MYNTTTTTGWATISIMAKKVGTYKLSFYIKSKAGMTLGSKKVVKVHAYSKNTVVKSVKIGKAISKDGDDLYTSLSKGKLKVTLNGGYKIKKIEVGKYTSTNECKYTTTKNGKNITLGSIGYSYYDDDYDTGTYTSSRSFLAYTYIKITYTDKYSADTSYECTTTVYVCRKATKWCY